AKQFKKPPNGRINLGSMRFEKETLFIEDQPAGTFRINTRANPRQIDLVGDEKTTHGIYCFDGDLLKICWPDPGLKDRPAELKTTPDDKIRLRLITLKKNPPKEKK